MHLLNRFLWLLWKRKGLDQSGCKSQKIQNPITRMTQFVSEKNVFRIFWCLLWWKMKINKKSKKNSLFGQKVFNLLKVKIIFYTKALTLPPSLPKPLAHQFQDCRQHKKTMRKMSFIEKISIEKYFSTKQMVHKIANTGNRKHNHEPTYPK